MISSKDDQKMTIEYEATFVDIEVEATRDLLKSSGAELVAPEFFQKRDVFFSPDGNPHSWLRVRQEKKEVTISFKNVDGDKIENQKEVCLKVENYDKAVDLLKAMGCKWKSYQETKRETWELDGAEITINFWPFLEPFLEVEGESEQQVKGVCEKLSLDYKQAVFCSTTELYKRKYNLPDDVINSHTPRITFDMENPFLNHGEK